MSGAKPNINGAGKRLCWVSLRSTQPCYSLEEEFEAVPDKGALAAFVPTGLGYTWEHDLLDDEVFKAIFPQGKRLLGPITTQAQIAAYASGALEDLLKIFTLIGDPASRLKE